MYPGSMSRFALLVLVLGACTKANPAVSCTDGSCSDPAFPFCDTTGAFGDPGTCVAVSCTPGEFAACAGSDVELRCSATGASYDQIQCANGCDDTTGCRVCQANQTVCADGKVQSCDANGAVVSSETCALGCFQDQPRCIDIDPSNNLATYLDMVQNPPDLHITPSTTGMPATINATTGDVVIDGATQSVPTFLVSPAPGDVGIRVYVVHDFTVDDVLSMTSGAVDGPAVAILATGAITINAKLGVNAGSLTSCVAGSGHDTSTDPDFTSGGGGGGNATAGAAGGRVVNATVVGGSAGGVHGTPELEPLVGGCEA